jgi:hypothetical protein
MLKARLVLAIATCGLILAGCEASHDRVFRELGSAGPIVVASIRNLGWGLPLRQGARDVRFSAIVTTWNEEGKSFADRQEMTADLVDGRIVSRGLGPRGGWTVTATLPRGGGKGDVAVEAQPGVEADAVRKRMGPTLLTLLHRLRGAYNLVDSERGRDGRQASVAGRDLVHVGVNSPQAAGYYFDAGNGMLQFVTAGADAPGRDGTVTVYQYAALPDGAAFPKTVQIVKIGKHVLVGQTPVAMFEITNVKF